MKVETIRDELWELSMDLHVMAARIEFIGKLSDTGCPDVSTIVTSLQHCSADLSKAAARCCGQHQPTDK